MAAAQDGAPEDRGADRPRVWTTPPPGWGSEPHAPGPPAPGPGPQRLIGGPGGRRDPAPTRAPGGGPPPPGPPRRTHRWGLGAFVLVWGVFLLSSLVVGAFVFGDGTLTAGGAALAIGVPQVLAAAAAIVVTRVRGNGPRADLGLVWSWRDVGLGLAFGFGGLVLTLAAAVVYVSVVGPDASSAVGDVFADLRAGPGVAVLILLLVVLVAPFCEEVVYRGLLWGALERRGLARWAVAVVSTAVFALAHLELTRAPLLLVVSIPIVAARLYTGRLLAGVVAHQVNNLLPGIVLMLGLLGMLPA